ncbi:MAG: YceD family protein [Armatimonadota bacterium]
MSDRGGSALKVDLRSLRAERGGTLLVAYHEPIASGIDDLPFLEPIEGALTLTNLGSLLRVQGRLATSVDLLCDLCAKPFRHRLKARVEEAIEWEEAAGSEAEDAETEYLRNIGDGIVLDGETLAREALVLALPMVTRCRSDCRGLCARCGADLRARQCACSREADDRPGDEAAGIDPRLGPLATWRDHRSSSGRA